MKALVIKKDKREERSEPGISKRSKLEGQL